MTSPWRSTSRAPRRTSCATTSTTSSSPRREAVTRKAHPVVVGGVIGGVVRGTWARKGDDLRVSRLDERPAPEQAIEDEAARLAGILGRDLRLAIALG